MCAVELSRLCGRAVPHTYVIREAIVIIALTSSHMKKLAKKPEEIPSKDHNRVCLFFLFVQVVFK